MDTMASHNAKWLHSELRRSGVTYFTRDSLSRFIFVSWRERRYVTVDEAISALVNYGYATRPPQKLGGVGGATNVTYTLWTGWQE